MPRGEADEAEAELVGDLLVVVGVADHEHVPREVARGPQPARDDGRLRWRVRLGRPEDLTDTDQSSMNTGSDASDDEEAVDDQIGISTTSECFYNYFYLGFDLLVSTRVPPSQPPPGTTTAEDAPGALTAASP